MTLCHMPQTPEPADGIAAFYWPKPMPLPPLTPEPVLYDWDVPDRRATGRCDDRAIAAGHVYDELMAAAVGTVGTVHKMTATFDGTPWSWTARRTETGVSWVSEWDRSAARPAG